MESKDTKKTSSLSMNGGQGPLSYAKNSNYQRTGLKLMKLLMHEEMKKKKGIDHLPSPNSNVFRIADVGCSVGPNTFFIVQEFIEIIKLSNYQYEDIEFEVLFNDLRFNDFNTLFMTLPVERDYFALGVPGSFYERLFPKASLHYVHSSYTLHWLSKIPKEVEDKSSLAWNKGRIHYGGSCIEVKNAYATRFAKDFESFLKARAEEVVSGGIMALLLVGTPMEVNISKCHVIAALELMGSTLLDMAKMGLVDEIKVDSFNIPIHYPSIAEVRNLVKINGQFSIEKMQEIARPATILNKQDIVNYVLFMRAWTEPCIRDHFGKEITAELFTRFIDKLMESGLLSNPSIVPMSDLFVFLKRQSQ